MTDEEKDSELTRLDFALRRTEAERRDWERKAEEYRAALAGLAVAATVGPFLYWLMGALR